MHIVLKEDQHPSLTDVNIDLDTYQQEIYKVKGKEEGRHDIACQLIHLLIFQCPVVEMTVVRVRCVKYPCTLP